MKKKKNGKKTTKATKAKKRAALPDLEARKPAAGDARGGLSSPAEMFAENYTKKLPPAQGGPSAP